MVMKYENELQTVQQELQDSYTLIKSEEKKRFLLEEEIRKILTKNMSTMNVEALHLFQSINSNREDFSNNLSSLPNSAAKSTISESQHSVIDGNTASNTNTNTSNGHDLSRHSTPTHTNTTFNANSSVLNSGGGVQSANQASEASVLLAKLNAQQYLYNTARTVHGNSTIRERSPSPANSPSHSPIPAPQEPFEPPQSNQSRVNFSSNSRIRFGNNNASSANPAGFSYGGQGHGSNLNNQPSEPSEGQPPHGQYLNKLSEMYRMSMQSSNKLAKMPTNQQPSQQYPPHSQSNSNGRSSSGGHGQTDRGSSSRNTMRTSSANSATKSGGGGFGNASSRFK
jgi:hypothetical protein